MTHSYQPLSGEYPLFIPNDLALLKKQVDFETWFPTNTKDERMYYIWLTFLYVVPLHKQEEVTSYLTHLYAKRGELISWLRHLETLGHLDSTIFSKRVLNIIEIGRKYAQSNTLGKTVKNATKDNIRNLMMKEEGSSLYRLIKEMETYKKEVETYKKEKEQEVKSNE